MIAKREHGKARTSPAKPVTAIAAMMLKAKVTGHGVDSGSCTVMAAAVYAPTAQNPAWPMENIPAMPLIKFRPSAKITYTPIKSKDEKIVDPSEVKNSITAVMLGLPHTFTGAMRPSSPVGLIDSTRISRTKVIAP